MGSPTFKLVRSPVATGNEDGHHFSAPSLCHIAAEHCACIEFRTPLWEFTGAVLNGRSGSISLFAHASSLPFIHQVHFLILGPCFRGPKEEQRLVAAVARMRVFEFDGIQRFNTLLYLDTDILVLNKYAASPRSIPACPCVRSGTEARNRLLSITEVKLINHQLRINGKVSDASHCTTLHICQG